MKHANRSCEYRCPYDVWSGKVSNFGQDKGKTVTAAHCKNNCGKYMRTCSLFKK